MARTIRVISSPSKHMDAAAPAAPWSPMTQPIFADGAQLLVDRMRSMSFEELEALWRSSLKLDNRFMDELAAIDVHHGTSPAILAFTGVEFRTMDPAAWSQDAADWLQEHFRILSGLYGMLRPCDAIMPYRLEYSMGLRMPCRMTVSGATVDEPARTLFKFWGEAVTQKLEGEGGSDGIHIVNLASEEYAHAIKPFLSPDTPMMTCVFLEEYALTHTDVQRGTNSKEARGTMARWMAENAITDPADLRNFNIGYHLDESRSDNETLAFIKE